MYEQIADYYDLLHAELLDDVRFVVQLAGETRGPVLELGCGTGRLLLPLARRGHQVVGVDSSGAMLARARAKLVQESESVQAHVGLVRGAFEEVRLDTHFGLAVIGYNTVMHLDPAALARCLSNVRRHLLPDGVLFIDVENPLEVHDPGQDGLLLLERLVVDEAADEIVSLTISSVGDGEQQRRESVWLVDVWPAKGGALKRLVARSTLHYLFAHQFEQKLAAAGLNLIGQYGDYDRQPYQADESPRLLLLASVRQ